MVKLPDGSYGYEHINMVDGRASIDVQAFEMDLGRAIGTRSAHDLAYIIHSLQEENNKLRHMVETLTRGAYQNYSEFGERIAALEKQVKDERALNDERHDELLEMLGDE